MLIIRYNTIICKYCQLFHVADFPAGILSGEDLLVFLHVFFVLRFGADFDADGLDL